jgi:hypothetical protein
MDATVQALATLVAAFFIAPLVEVAFQAFRAPSIELQRSNETLQGRVTALEGELATVQSRLSQLLDAKPDVNAQVIEAGDMVYLEIENRGASAVFHAMLEVNGASDWPKKETFGRWDAVHNKSHREIPNGAKARLRLAKRVREGDTLHWVVYGFTSFGAVERRSAEMTFLKSNPPTDEWNVSLWIDLYATPGLTEGPVKASVVLYGNGRFTPSAPADIMP